MGEVNILEVTETEDNLFIFDEKWVLYRVQHVKVSLKYMHASG